VSAERASPAERVYLEMVASYQTAILNFVYRIVGDIDVAEDLTQETYLKAFRAMGTLDLADEAAPLRRAWLYRIARNTANDHLRRRARLRWLSIDSLRLQSGDDPAADVGRREPISRALEALPTEHREVLLLFSQAGLNASEVAEVLGITPEAARKRRQRARDAFAVAYSAASSGDSGRLSTNEL
jgi:RNA polymerase sigma-70 factor (ECF subfamily)